MKTNLFLETKQFILKLPNLSDFNELLALRTDPDVMRYIGNGDIQTREQVQDFLTMAMDYQEKYGMGFCSVFEKESGDFIGQAGLFHTSFNDTQPDIEIAYRLHKKYWGRGYATECVKALIRWGFEHLSVQKLVAGAHPDNIASQKVLIKSGLDYRGIVAWPSRVQDVKIFLYEIYKQNAIELVPYDRAWPQSAASEIILLRDVLPKEHILDIQHVGSTAVPGMLAKPIIDIQIATSSLNTLKPIAISTLKKLGYEYWYDNPDKERLFFAKGMPPFGDKRTHHVHIVEPGSRHWSEKIMFRDYLISHPDIAREYEQLKIKLAREYTYDREQYTREKTNFINTILGRFS